MSSNWSNKFRMASSRSADIMAACSRSMDIRMAFNRFVEVMTASVELRMAFNRYVEVIVNATRFRMASSWVLRPWRPPTGMLRLKGPQICHLGVRADFYTSSRVRTIQNVFP
jgi:hypothetical protein